MIDRVMRGQPRILGGEPAALEQRETSGTALTASARAAGRHSSIASSAAWPWTRAALAGSPAPTWRLTWGRMAVPSAAPITPSGSWFRRSA